VENDPVNSVDPTGNQKINPGFVVCLEDCLGEALLETGCIEACYECGELLPNPIVAAIPCAVCVGCAGSAAIGCLSECSEFLTP
jgi:hypothetical protein